MSQLLILSGAYPDQELISEFGNLPPVFLPVGNRRLYELQVENIPHSSLWITLPNSFSPDKVDLDKLSKLNANLIFTNESLSLGEAFFTGTKSLPPCGTHILFGDTLVRPHPGIKFDSNTIASGENTEIYPWHELNRELAGGHKNILAGYFYVNNLEVFRMLVEESGFDFIEAVYRQHEKEPWIVTDEMNWLDFGHIHTYFQSKAKISTARSFNEISPSRRIVTKYSEDSSKILAEINWFENIPKELSPYLVQYAGVNHKDNKIGYSTEFIYLNTLAEHFVFGALPNSAWAVIFESCLEFLKAASNFTGEVDATLGNIYMPKTVARLNHYANQDSFRIDQPWIFNGVDTPSLIEIVDIVGNFINTKNALSSVIHGDLCFSNIFYDFRSRCIKLIDPRGLDAHGNKNLYGDPRYDIAKLHHSVIGGYDHIIAGRYQLHQYGRRIEFQLPFAKKTEVQAHFLSLSSLGINFNSKEIFSISVLLFISMLPLHSDRPDRQIAFIANALRLYLSIENMP